MLNNWDLKTLVQAKLYGIRHRVSRSPQQFNLGRVFFARGAFAFYQYFIWDLRKKSATTSNALVTQSFVFRLGLCHVILVLSFCYSSIWLFLLLLSVLCLTRHFEHPTSPAELFRYTNTFYLQYLFCMALWTTWFMVVDCRPSSFTLERNSHISRQYLYSTCTRIGLILITDVLSFSLSVVL